MSSTESLIWLVEIEAYDETVPGVVTLRYSSDEAFYDGSLNEYLPRISEALTLEQNLFKRFATFGASSAGVGVVVLENSDGALDVLEDYGFDGRAIRVLSGSPDAAYASFKQVFSGTMQNAEFTFDEVRIRVRDKLALFDVPAQEATFAGTNVGPTGIEGLPDDIEGQRKPRLFGKMKHIPAILVNASDLVYGVNWDRDGNTAAVASFDAIYDQGVSITIDADYADLAALQGASIPVGEAATCVAEGLFRMNRIFGAVTCDVTESGTAADNKLPRVLERIIVDAGGTVTAGDVSALESSSYFDVGYWINGEDYRRVLDRVAASDGVSYFGSRTGDTEFRLKRVSVNEISQPNNFSASSWTKSNTAVSGTTTAPDGRSTAQKIVATSVNAQHLLAHDILPLQSSGTFTACVYAKAGEYSDLLLSIDNSGNTVSGQFDLSAETGSVGQVGSATGIEAEIVDIGNGWFLCRVVGTLGALGASAPIVQLGVGTGAYLGDDTSGIYFWGVEVFIGNAPVATLIEADGETPLFNGSYDIIDIERRASGDRGRGVPAYKVEVEWGPIGIVLSESELASSLITSNPEITEFFENEFRVKTEEDTSVQTKHPLAPTLEFSSQLYSASDAETVASRLLSVYSSKRSIYTVDIEIQSDLADTIELGQVVELFMSRWDLSFRKRFLIIGIEFEASSYQYTLTLWG